MRSDADPQIDLGGPDGLGPYVRVNYDKGRAIVRVRYAPSDMNIFASNPTGALRDPGQARMYLIIESIGRPGVVNYNDPTTLLASDPIQFTGYADGATFRAALGAMRNRDNQFVRSRKVIAFASIGIIESALFITNKFELNTPAEIGPAEDLNVTYKGATVNPPMTLGGKYKVFDPGDPPVPEAITQAGGGTLYSNASLTIHGRINANLNKHLGESWDVADTIQGADDNASQLNLIVSDWNGAAWVPVGPGPLTNATSPSINSRNPNFSTLNEILRDGAEAIDAQGNTRSAPRKTPPSILRTDPDTGLNRYLALTRDSGRLGAGGNSGRWGHGGGTYVGNTYDRQIPADADGRMDVGSQESLIYDWLNPGNGQDRSGWKGPYYVPPGAFLQLSLDGFTISLDGTNRPPTAPDNQRTWRREDGTDSGLGTIRFRIGNVNGVPYIINTLTPGVNISAVNPDFSKGLPFSGVLYFEGNVRVRGVIPTDRQLTVVSMGSIYIEGSITKGLLDSTGARLTRPSRSMLMLMAKDYVALNTTQFFGPSFGQTLQAVNEDKPTLYDWQPLRIKAGDGQLEFLSEFLLDPDNPATTANDPSTYRPYIQDYKEFNDPAGNTGAPLSSQLLVSHAMDSGPAPYSFFTLNINFGLPDSAYLFNLSDSNAATPLYPPGYTEPTYAVPNYARVYGLGYPWQRYGKFESTAFPMWDQPAATATVSAGKIDITSSPEGRYSFILGETGSFLLKSTNMAAGATNDYIWGRNAIVPHDIRIEASMFAEEGSFFVIPGLWFNPNTDDTREKYATLGATAAERDTARLNNQGSSPSTPFFGEPLDVRITILGAVSENMPPTISQQAEATRKWGWIPRDLGASGRLIPWSHVPAGYNIGPTGSDLYVPNLTIIYDPTLATSRAGGYDPGNAYVRQDDYLRPLAPMPRLPVSPTLSYFGEVNP